MTAKPLFLLTDPAHYEVSYVINPWMTPGEWAQNRARHSGAARQAFVALKRAIEAAGADVRVMEGVAGLPDLVFPANAAIVLDRRALVARFSCVERQGEESVFLQEFEQLQNEGIFTEVGTFPEGVFQEGAGDCIWDKTRGQFWAGFGQRSVRASLDVIKDFFRAPVVPLELISPRFYHLDVCFLPLTGGEIVYYPPAFSDAAQETIRALVPADYLIEASDADAAAFSVNAVNIGRTIIMARPPERLKRLLEARGYQVSGIDLAPFMMSGGGAYCMTLRLDRSRDDGTSSARPCRTAAEAS
ncbi:MAG: amidinotransferase [Alphaproteobacteria bacterium]|nr:amidinotransferase [Alphaproteobacteria bacterium]